VTQERPVLGTAALAHAARILPTGEGQDPRHARVPALSGEGFSCDLFLWWR